MVKTKNRIKLISKKRLIHDHCPFCGCKVKISKQIWNDYPIRFYITHDAIVKEETGIDCIISHTILFTSRDELIERWEGGF